MSTYTKALRARIAADFRQAKKNLWDGKGRRGNKPPFICFALQTREARRVVQTRLA